MALNVNIICKDSKGNLQALMVNSEGNLEISDSLGWGESLQDISDKLDILADKLELEGVIGLLADRPPASEMRGRGYYAWDETDGHKLKYSDGTDWVVNQ